MLLNDTSKAFTDIHWRKCAHFIMLNRQAKPDFFRDLYVERLHIHVHAFDVKSPKPGLWLGGQTILMLVVKDFWNVWQWCGLQKGMYSMVICKDVYYITDWPCLLLQARQTHSVGLKARTSAGSSRTMTQTCWTGRCGARTPHQPWQVPGPTTRVATPGVRQGLRQPGQCIGHMCGNPRGTSGAVTTWSMYRPHVWQPQGYVRACGYLVNV